MVLHRLWGGAPAGGGWQRARLLQPLWQYELGYCSAAGLPALRARLTARIGFVSDLHILSRYGLVPTGWRQRDDPMRRVQSYLYSCFQHFVRTCPPLDVLVVVGDIAEGVVQLRAEPRGIATDDPVAQAKAATQVLRPLRDKAKKLYLVEGTPFHDGHGQLTQIVGDNLGAERWASGDRYAGQLLVLKWQGLNINISHHQTRGWMWLGGSASRQAVLAAAAEAARKVPRADVIVRADLHCQLVVRTLNKWVCFLPGWTMPNPHAIRKMEATRAYLQTDIGGAVMTKLEDGTIGWWPPETYQLAETRVHTV